VEFIPGMAKVHFKQSSVPHDPSGTILTCLFAAQKTFKYFLFTFYITVFLFI